MKTKKDAIVEPAVDTDSSTSPESSPKDWTDKEFERIFERAEKIFANAEPPEVLEKPFKSVDGEWLTVEEVIEYARNLEKSAGNS